MKSRIIKKIINDPGIVIDVLNNQGYLFWWPDKHFLKWQYKRRTGSKLNIKNPIAFNEKLQWLKLYNRKPMYTKLVDKYEVRSYIKKAIGDEHLIPLFGVWDNFDEIDFEKLPDQFVLKTTHDSGGVVICDDKNNFNKNSAKKILNKSMKKNYYYSAREWPYKNVKPKIIAEEYLQQINNDELVDYRFFCFNGEPRFVAIDFNINDKRHTRRNIYDLEWNLLPVKISYPNEFKKDITKPINLEKMVALSRELSKDIPHVRVDFYNVNGKILFGEMTFFHQSGYGRIEPSEFENIMGNWLTLPK